MFLLEWSSQLQNIGYQHSYSYNQQEQKSHCSSGIVLNHPIILSQNFIKFPSVFRSTPTCGLGDGGGGEVFGDWLFHLKIILHLPTADSSFPELDFGWFFSLDFPNPIQPAEMGNASARKLAIKCHLHMGVVRNSFFSKRPFLAPKKFTLAKLSPFPQKTFAGPYVGLYLGIFVRKQKLDKAAAHSRVAFWLYRWSLLTFSGQFWHSHTETKGSPASCLSGNKT